MPAPNIFKFLTDGSPLMGHDEIRRLTGLFNEWCPRCTAEPMYLDAASWLDRAALLRNGVCPRCGASQARLSGRTDPYPNLGAVAVWHAHVAENTPAAVGVLGYTLHLLLAHEKPMWEVFGLPVGTQLRLLFQTNEKETSTWKLVTEMLYNPWLKTQLEYLQFATMPAWSLRIPDRGIQVQVISHTNPGKVVSLSLDVMDVTSS